MSTRQMTDIGLVVRSLDRMTRFYQDAFGCVIHGHSHGSGAPLGLPDARINSVSLGLGKQVIRLDCFDPPGLPWPEDARSNDFTFQHLAFAVRDMAEAYLHLKTITGWTPISRNGPVQLPQSSGGAIAFKFRDPEGHPLELLEFPGKGDETLMFYQINHSAIVVKDTERSLKFYGGALGLSAGERSVNRGTAQAQLDDLDDPLVRVTALLPTRQVPPHVELLCYEAPPSGSAPPNNKTAADAIATRLVFAVDDVADTVRRAVAAGGVVVEYPRDSPTALLRDPDGHDVLLDSLGPLDHFPLK